MAFGGVETGKNKAQEALKPITKGNITGLKSAFIAAKDKAIGIKIVVAAVLLIKFENNTVINAKTRISAYKLKS